MWFIFFAIIIRIKQININKIFNLINAEIKNKNFSRSLNYLRKLRSNKCFIELSKDTKFLSKLNNIKRKIIKNKKNINTEIFEDLLWCIEKEIIKNSEDILKFIDKNNIEKSYKSIIFVNYFLKATEALNYLETRGRDSASLSLNFKCKSKINFQNINKINNSRFFFNEKKLDENNYFVNITLKYANQIGYSGENLKNLISSLTSFQILRKINFDYVDGFYIVGHTRWASTGEVNLSNCHPLINSKKNEHSYFYMNGDIYNYQDLKKNKKFKLTDINCNNDLSCLPELIETNNKIMVFFLT